MATKRWARGKGEGEEDRRGGRGGARRTEGKRSRGWTTGAMTWTWRWRVNVADGKGMERDR